MEERLMVVSRVQLRALLKECFSILAAHGFTSYVAPIPDPFEVRFEKGFEHSAGGMAFDLEESDVGDGKKTPEQIRNNVTSEEFDVITLECALLFAQHGSPIHYNECLNALRATLRDIVCELGYVAPGEHRTQKRWFELEEWVVLARKCGVPEERILELHPAAEAATV